MKNEHVIIAALAIALTGTGYYAYTQHQQAVHLQTMLDSKKNELTWYNMDFMLPLPSLFFYYIYPYFTVKTMVYYYASTLLVHFLPQPTHYLIYVFYLSFNAMP